MEFFAGFIDRHHFRVGGCKLELGSTIISARYDFVFVNEHRADGDFPFLYARVCLVAQSCPALCDPIDYSPPAFSVHGDSPGKNTRVSWNAPLQGIFPTYEFNPGLPHCRWILYHLSHCTLLARKTSSKSMKDFSKLSKSK